MVGAAPCHADTDEHTYIDPHADPSAHPYPGAAHTYADTDGARDTIDSRTDTPIDAHVATKLSVRRLLSGSQITAMERQVAQEHRVQAFGRACG